MIIYLTQFEFKPLTALCSKSPEVVETKCARSYYVSYNVGTFFATKRTESTMAK